LTDKITPKVEVLKDMVEYQKGAVVSRTLMDKPQGTVTLFAFAEGEGLSEHTTPYDALVQVLDGEVEITIGGKAAPRAKGSGPFQDAPRHAKDLRKSYHRAHEE
jgi:quercetin dioxygenase-like cupin family protein